MRSKNNIRIHSFAHIGVTVSNFEKAVKWYHKFFGCRLISEKVLDEKMVEELYPLYKTHGTSLRLGFLRTPKGGVIEIFEFTHKGEGNHVEWNRLGPSHLAFDVSNVKMWYNRFKDQLEFVHEPRNTDGNDWVFLRDPDGNLVELIDLKLNYSLNRLFGGLAGRIMKKTIFKEYYK